MIAELSWRPGRRDDRAVLQEFTCAVPREHRNSGRPQAHPAPWAEEVEKWIRNLRPPLGERLDLSLGFLRDELVAVVMVDDSTEGPEFFHIAFLAVSLRFHRAGLGTAALEHAIELSLGASAPYLRSLIISANIHEGNEASQACFRKAGFTPDTEIDQYRQWLLQIDIAEDEDS
ncbi:GNAT family N-acetyltransferase [Leifsonia aquatica]|uniref:GNAT family N-acetyltransferase n=1 Tax=Leifsonia aquatica TaxID=144185 RepID=UPI003850E246